MKGKVLPINIILTLSLMVWFSCSPPPPSKVYVDPPFQAPFYDVELTSQFGIMTTSYNGRDPKVGFRFNRLLQNNLFIAAQAYPIYDPYKYNKLSYYELALGYNYKIRPFANVSLMTGSGYGLLSADYSGTTNYVDGVQQLEERFSTRYLRPYVQTNLVFSAYNLEFGVIGRLATFRTFQPIQFNVSSNFSDDFAGYGFFVRWGVNRNILYEIQVSKSYSLGHSISSKYYSLETENFGLNIMLSR